MQLPTPAGQAALEVLDTRSVAKSSKAAAGGTCSVVFPAVPGDSVWLVDRVLVSCTSTTPTAAYVYDDEPSNLTLLSGTKSGNFDYDDVASPYLIEAGKALQVIWTGCSDGAVGSVRIQYRLGTRAA